MRLPVYPADSWGRSVVDYMRSITLVEGYGHRVRRDASGTSLVVARSLPGEAFPWSRCAFGFSLAGAVVTIYAGEIQIGVNPPVACADADKTLSQDHQYIAAEYTWATKTIAIGDPTTDKPVSDGDVYRRWLYQFRLQNGYASLEKIGHFGNLEIAAHFGD